MTTIKNLRVVLLAGFFLAGIQLAAHAQTDTTFLAQKITLQQYLNTVGKKNIGYAAERYKVDIAAAGVESAKVFPDPSLSLGISDNQQAKLQLGRTYEVGLGATLELGGKRSARINLAKSQTELSSALLMDFFRNLRADAATAYYNALQQSQLVKVQENSYQTMKKLANADSIRFKLGEISETDARQSKLEANTMLSSLFQLEADWKISLSQLSFFAGRKELDTLLFVPEGDFERLDRPFVLADLIVIAQNSRADAVAALNNKTVSENSLKLVKANRKIDLGLSTAFTYNTEATNEVAPSPAHHTVNAGISFPLKFSNFNKGDLHAAKFSINQSVLQYDEVLMQIQIEVTQASFNYKAARKQVEQYKNGLLSEAKKIFNGKVYSYKRGESSLLEVLDAQRTYNEVQQGYYESLYGYAAALIQLERAAGIWDLD